MRGGEGMNTFVIAAKVHGRNYVAMDCQGSFSNCLEDGMFFFEKDVAESYVGRVEHLIEKVYPEEPASVHVLEHRVTLRKQDSNK